MADDYSSEVWIPVEGYEGDYSISNMGRLRRDSVARTAKAGSIKSVNIMPNGYCGVRLYKDGKDRHFTIHRLVAAAFIGPANGLQVNHKNGIRKDNRVGNLEYVTPAENQIHARWQLGKWRPLKLTADMVRELRARYAAGETQVALAKCFGVCQASVSEIINRDTWAHVA